MTLEEITFYEYMDALDVLRRAQQYLRAQFKMTMPPDVAAVHFASQAILLRLRNAVQDEAEVVCLGGNEATR